MAFVCTINNDSGLLTINARKDIVRIVRKYAVAYYDTMDSRPISLSMLDLFSEKLPTVTGYSFGIQIEVKDYGTVVFSQNSKLIDFDDCNGFNVLSCFLNNNHRYKLIVKYLNEARSNKCGPLTEARNQMQIEQPEYEVEVCTIHAPMVCEYLPNVNPFFPRAYDIDGVVEDSREQENVNNNNVEVVQEVVQEGLRPFVDQGEVNQELEDVQNEYSFHELDSGFLE